MSRSSGYCGEKGRARARRTKKAKKRAQGGNNLGVVFAFWVGDKFSPKMLCFDSRRD